MPRCAEQTTTTPINTRAAQPIWLSLDVADRDFRETALADIPLIPGDGAYDCRVHRLRGQESSVMRRVSVGAEPGATHEVPPPAPNPLTATAPITLDRSSEARRAYRESRTAMMLLQQRWPAAFPQTPH